MGYKVALAGNPNSGKTTLFNALTGSNQRVGNWPGVTVDKKEGNLKGHNDIVIQDLPGIYSLSPYTMEEVISRKYLIDEKPDLIVNLVDASNFIRNMYLTTQLIELGIPTVIALNMMDVVRARGDEIDKERLSEIIGAPVVEIVASNEEGIDKLINEIVKSREEIRYPHPITFSSSLESRISKVENILEPYVPEYLRRYYSIKAIENDQFIFNGLDVPVDVLKEIYAVQGGLEAEYHDDVESIVITQRYDEIEKYDNHVIRQADHVESITEKIDKIVTNRILAIPIFAAIMFLVYYIAISTIGTGATDALNGFFEDTLTPLVASSLESIGINEVLVGLVADGIIAGVGAVLGFLPQMLVLFLLLSILEDIGYMARVAFIMDRVFRRFGLSGKSFIPLMIGTGCSVPGIQASRTIESDRDRKITIMTTSFMPCSAKLPVIALIAGSFFPDNKALITFSLYVIGILSVIISGIILKKFKEFASEPAPFVMELPNYHLPRPATVARDVFNKGLSFVKKAGTVILVSSVLIWTLSNFDTSLSLVDEATETSILARFGSLISGIFGPLGWGTWQATVATITGFVAKENVVSTLGIVLGLGAEVTEETGSLLTAFGSTMGNEIAGYSFLLFNMLCMPCFAAVGAIKTEFNDWRWTLGTVAYLMGYAYVISLIYYQLSMWIRYSEFSLWTGVAFFLLALMLFLIFRPDKYENKRKKLVKAEAN